MALVIQDRVRETTQVVGTGSATLLGAVTGYQSFSTIGNGNTTYYAIADQGGPNWEVGIGTWATGGTLARTTVLSSSNSGSLVNFTAGTKDVFVTYPSENAVYTSNGPGTSGYVLVSAGAGAASIWTAPTSVVGGAGGSNTQVQYNSSGSLAGSANLTFNGTTLTLANDASISGLTVGKGGGAYAHCTAVGYQALNSLSADEYATAFGYNALKANTSGADGVAFGCNALVLNTTGSENSAFGTASLAANVSGSYNTAIGSSALNANTTASNNTAVGYQAGYTNSTGTQLTAFGVQAGYTNNANNGAFFGYQAGYSNTSGTNNAAFGAYRPLYTNTTGSFNTAIGDQALYSNTTASNNTAVGYQAGYAVTSGVQNIIVGSGSGAALTTGNNNVIIGYNANASSSNVGQSLAIGYGAVDKGSTTGMISPNGGGVYQGNNSATWSITSDARLKKNIVDNTTGLSAITAIQVRNFEYRTKDEITELEPQNAIDIKGVQLGAIAQELQAILPDCVKTESTGVMSVDTTNLTWYLINAVKELNAKITALENK